MDVVALTAADTPEDPVAVVAALGSSVDKEIAHDRWLRASIPEDN